MLKINNQLMPDPATAPVKVPRVSLSEWQSPQNDLNIQKMGPLKYDWVFSFEKLEPLEYALFEQYFYAGTEFLVEYVIGIDTVLNGYCYLTVDDIPLSLNRLYNISLKVKPV